MNRLAKLQLFGPFVLAITIIAAELAAYLLAAKPSSTLAWYLNIEIFGMFQRSHSVLGNFFGVQYLQLTFVAIPMLALCALSLACRHRLVIAITSHLSFIYACFVAYTWFLIGSPSLHAASLAQSQIVSIVNLPTLNLPAGPQLAVMLMLLVTSLLSFAGSHVHYLRALRQT